MSRPSAPEPIRDPAPGAPDLVHGLFDPQTDIGRALAAVDWPATPLGPVEHWPTSLRNVVRLLLGSQFAMWMGWGPELIFLCNEAYRRDTLGAKFPWALGRPAGEVWSEIWPDIRPRVESVTRDGISTWDESLMLFLERSGYQEETYHTFSYSPITGDDGRIAGMLCVVSEDTARVLSERRMAVVRELGTALAAASTRAEVFSAAGLELARDPRNVPFALGYVFDEAHEQAELAFTSGVARGAAIAPIRLELGGGADNAWPAAELAAGRSEVVAGLPERFADVPSGAWSEPTERALAVPLAQPGRRRPAGFLVVGLNRYRALDADTRGFIELVAGQVAAAITRARAFEEERRRAEDLAELDRAKTTFFTNVSHELRTPLTLLLGPAADALADVDAPLPPAQRARVDVIQRNAERLLKLVNTLLDFSRMESGRVQARFEPLDLARYTADLAAMFEAAMRRAGLTLTVDCAPLPQRAHVDREMWAKIVLNLLSNALKATFTGGVTVRLAAREGGAELSVTDTGIGIPPAEQARLFERFHRVVGAELRSHEGSGIGLALVAELTALHGGSVAVASRPGHGSTFTVRIPIGTAHLPDDQVVHDSTDELPPLREYGAGYLAEADRWFDSTRGSESGPDGTGRPRVLVVDDNADMRDYVSQLLDQDYAVATAIDGVEALELARADPPDLVLTDVMMPRLDGFGLLAVLRSDPTTMHVPVVMLSARSGEEAAVLGLEAGADDYLVKPFSARELRARVRANLELDRVRRVADELSRSRALLDQAEELAHVGSWELDLRDGSLVGSAEYLRILGVPAEQLSSGGLDLAFESLHPVDRDRVAAALRATQETGEPLDLEARVVDPAGGLRVVRARGVLQRQKDGTPAFIRGSAQDVTDQRRAERAMAASAAARESAAREHAIAAELQRSLLPASTPRGERLDVGTYYVAGVEGTQAGGDWYDVIDLGDGRSALVIGDVMGRGVRAAAVMGQLRATVRAYARLDLSPAALLGLLDAAVRDVSDSTIVTCVYGICDTRTGRFTYGNAGHLPPLLSVPGSPTRRLVSGDPPLGSGSYRGSVETVDIPPGARLTLYTDGLVEHRGSDIDTGIDRLAHVLDHSDAPVEGLPGVLAEALLPHEPDDDVAVLAARVAESGSRRVATSVPPGPAGVGEVRRVVAAAIDEWGIAADVRSDVQLIVSELVTNAIRYGAPPMECRVRCEDRRIVIDVSDGGDKRPRVRPFDPGAPNGRGLHLVAGLAASWGVRPTGAGKSIWCTVPIGEGQA